MFARKQTRPPESAIRQATRRDIEAIGDLWVELMHFHASLDNRFGLPPQGRANYMRHAYMAIRDHNYHLLVAEEDGRIVGYILGYVAQNPPIFPHPLYGFIADLCVTQTARRKGTGRRLVETLCAWFRERSLTSVQLNVAHNNPTSQAFWRGIGCSDYLDHMWMSL